MITSVPPPQILGIYQAIAPADLLSTSVQITGGSGGPAGPIWGNIAAVEVTNPQAGQFYLVTCDVESTDPQTYDVQVNTEVIVGPALGSGSDYAIRSAAMNNTTEIHHQVISRSAIWQMDSPSNNWFTFRISAADGNAGTDDFYTIESLSGQILLSVAQLTNTIPLGTPIT